MENKGNPDPSRHPSRLHYVHEPNKTSSKWTALTPSLSYEEYVAHFGKTKVRLPFIIGYRVHTRSYNGNTISTIQLHLVQEGRLTTVIQLNGGTS